MRLTKEEFIKAVNTFEEMMEEEDKIYLAMQQSPEWIPGTWISAFYDLLIDVCDLADVKYNDLDYYCYELNFGKEDTCPDLKSPEQLYESLLANSPE